MMIIYDTEIKNAIGHPTDRLPGIRYCGGFDDFDGMGVSVLCAYDSTAERWRVFCQDNLYEFQNLVDGQVVAGFCNHGFDDLLMRAHGVIIHESQSYDLLHEIWRAKGLGDDFIPESHGGLSLDDICRVNLDGCGKSGLGAMAPVLWQRGMHGSVIDYCMNDVWLLKQLLDIVICRGGLICPKSGQFLELRKPDEAFLCQK